MLMMVYRYGAGNGTETNSYGSTNLVETRHCLGREKQNQRSKETRSEQKKSGRQKMVATSDVDTQ
jgi:hypothetical protein